MIASGKALLFVLTFAAPSSGSEGDDWWAFRPIANPRPPIVEDDSWSANPIDRFVLRALADREMVPAPRAEKIVLVRRLYFDLIGLPPSPAEIDAFLDDESPDAWERLVDALLRDRRHGEHWARFWLDLVRYSESDGWNQDAYRPDIWRYRDWVVNAFNHDMPYRRFVRAQLAGDEMPSDEPANRIAAGFLRLGIYEYNQRDARGHWDDIVNEMTEVAGDVFFGVSMGCARCHDHKFDPITQVDYFKLRAFFDPVIWRDDIPAATKAEQAEYERRLADWKAATTELRARLDAVLAPYEKRKWKSTVEKFPIDIQDCFRKPDSERTSWEHQMAYLVARQYLEEGGGPFKSLSKEDKARRAEIEKELAEFDSMKPKPLPSMMTVTEFDGPISPTSIPDSPDVKSIEPGFPSVLTRVDVSRNEARASAVPPTGRRTALARWIGRADNPLTPRVIVNRIWQQHFGAGIVATPSDFGKTGQPPTHPELLDWLAMTFIESGWSFKHLHRLILTSATWRQSSRHPRADEYRDRDPSATLLWRARVRRLSAEQIRDACLAVSGELDSRVGGPSVDADAPRRSLYVKRFRNKTQTFLHAFDAAAGLKSVACRGVTTIPTQALTLMNGDFALGRARAMAERLEDANGDARDARNRVRRAVRLTWGREPTESELTASLELIDSPEGGLADFCHVLLNSNEFLYVD